ncbi:MAG: rRNA maturation RNase YbeY [Thalassovita sp.]
MLTDTILDDDRWTAANLTQIAETAARATLMHLGLDPDQFEIAILACDDAHIATLNADFRGKPTPTNVLSWPSEDRSVDLDGAAPALPMCAIPSMAEELGDIAIAWETCLREAHEADKALSDHLTHLIVHATLHLLGYDHIRDKDATLMEAIETEILGKMGISDPYSEY